MTIRVTLAHNEARLAATRDKLDTGALHGRIEIRSGAKPTAVGDAPAGTLLATVELTKPCGTITSGVLTLTPETDAVVVADGTAGHARWIDGDDTTVMDSDVGTLLSSAEVRLATLSLLTGNVLTLVSASLG